MVFKGDEEARKLFYLYENVVIEGLPDAHLVEKSVVEPGGKHSTFTLSGLRLRTGPHRRKRTIKLLREKL